MLFRIQRSIFVGLAIAAFAVFAAAQTNKAIEAELLRHLNNMEKWSNDPDARNDAALEKENKLLKQKLERYGSRAAILKYDFKALTAKMFITTSKDGNLRIYSWDAKTGGTARWYESVFQYRGKSGKVRVWSPASVEGEVCEPFYNQIFQMDATSGRLYLANSTAICSTSLNTQNLSIFRIDGEKLNPNVRLIRTSTRLTNSVGFEYDFFSVVDRPERPIKLFFFDEAKKSFRFPVVIADDKVPQGRVTNKFITYRFDGRHFVKSR